jgi:hypothetical protein
MEYGRISPPRDNDIDFGALPAEPRRPGCGERWKWRTVSIVAVGGCLALRVLDLGDWFNVGADIGVGVFAHAAISFGQERVSLSKIRQVSSTLLGQAIAIFPLTAAYTDTADTKKKTILLSAIIALFGANIEIGVRWFFEKKVVREESQRLVSDQANQSFENVPLVKRPVAIGLKILASGGFAAAYYKTNDLVAKGLSSFGSFFYAGQIGGEALIKWVNGKITENEQEDEDEAYHRANGTLYRTLKTGLTTLPYIFMPLCFIPWGANPDSDERIRQLSYVGASLGFLDGIMNESKMARLRNVPVARLEEFQTMKGHRLWDIAVPLIAIGGLVYYMIREEGYELKDEVTKSALGAMFGTFVSTLVCGKVVDLTWNPQVRKVWHDRFFTFFMASPRVAGMWPLYAFLAITNSLQMNEKAIEGQNAFQKAMNVMGWSAFGFSMARELCVTSSDRVGSLLLKFPLMAFVTGATTAKIAGTGDI